MWQGIQIYRPVIYGNSARMLTPEEKTRAPPEHTHQWTVALRSAASFPTNGENEGDFIGGRDDLSHFIKRVTFKLHESFPNPNRGEPLARYKERKILNLVLVYSDRQTPL